MPKRKGIDVTAQMEKILDEFADRLNMKADEVMEEECRKTVADLRATSPKDTGEYRNDWEFMHKQHKWIVYNKDHYRLTHLLNNGHVVKNQYGRYSRYRGDKHIDQAEQRSIADLFREMGKKI